MVNKLKNFIDKQFRNKTKSIHDNESTINNFTKAIDFLNSPTQSIRIGGVHILGEIANSDNQYEFIDKSKIIYLLCTYIREKMPKKSGIKEHFDPSLFNDIQTAINVISNYIKNNPLDPIFNLSNASLVHFTFKNTNFSGINLNYTSLYGTKIIRSNFTEAIIKNTLFTKTTFRQTLLPDIRTFENSLINSIIFDSAYVNKDNDLINDLKDKFKLFKKFYRNAWMYDNNLNDFDKQILKNNFNIENFDDYRKIIKAPERNIISE